MSHPSASRVSPITLEVVRHALYAIAEEMSVIIMRSARSPLLKEAGDLSSALTDPEGRLIAQGRDIPIHMGVMGFTVKELLKRVPVESLREGDVWFLNLPEVGGNHLPDVKAVRPVFHQGRLIAFAINLAHWADIGGAVPGSYVPSATECYQEGLRLAPVRLFTAAGPERHTIDLVLSNVRGREEREGDMLAQFAANDVAARRLVELAERYGVGTLAACFDRLHAESEQQMRAAIAALPDGVWEGEDHLDDDGVDDRPIRIAVRVDIRGEQATFDFTGTAPQARGPVNTTYFIACSAVYYAMKALVAPDVPPNDGCYRPLRVIVPPGTVLSADPDRPVVGGNHETSQRVVDAIFRALAPALGDRIAAGGPTTAGLMIFGSRRPDGRWGIFYEVHGGGAGATIGADGSSATRVHMSNVMNTPVEVIEHEYPIVVEEQALRDGSGGDGHRRGGLGLRRAYRVTADETRLTTMLERRVIPPWGIAGGADGLPFRVTLNPGPRARPARQGDGAPLRRGPRAHRDLGGRRLRPARRAAGRGPRGRPSRGLRAMKLADRIAIVTGAAKGMGRDICLTLAGEGANVVLAARDVPPLEAVAREVEAVGRRALVVSCDVVDEAAVERLVARTRETFAGRVDILVNAAGVTGPVETPVWEIRAEDWDQVLGANVRGTFLPTKHVLPVMIAQRYGKIVNISGTSGLRGYKLRAAYSASKWALRGFTRTVALEVGAYNINVNALHPGIVTGERMARLCRDKAKTRGTTPEAIHAEYVAEMALRRVTTQEDIARAVLFLVSEDSKNMTGQSVTVDGGWDV